MVGLAALVAGSAIAGAATIIKLSNGGRSPEVPVAMGYNGAGNEIRQTGTTPPSQTATALSGPASAGSSTPTSSTPTSTTASPATKSSSASSSSPEPPPPPPPAPPQPTQTPENDQPGSPNPALAAQVVTLVNQVRPGCPISVDDRLTASAQEHSTDMANQNYFSHTSLDQRTFDQRIKTAGYPRPGAENIAKGQRTAEAVMDAWMNSPGHRTNIENCAYKNIGVAVDTNGFLWTQNFGF